MKAALALVVDAQTHNVVRKMAWQLHTNYGMSLETSRLPPHISLKQPFSIDTLDTLERYAIDLAAEHIFQPIRLSLSEAFLSESAPTSLIVWLAVEEQPWLRSLHTRVNQDMRHLFGSADAPFDGDAYRFHLTVAIDAVDESASTQIIETYHNQSLDLLAVPTALALFVYDDAAGYMTYGIFSEGRV